MVLDETVNNLSHLAKITSCSSLLVCGKNNRIIFCFWQASGLSLTHICVHIIMYIQLFREMLSEKVHATIVKGIVGGFVGTVLQRNLKEWYGRPLTYVCEY